MSLTKTSIILKIDEKNFLFEGKINNFEGLL